jgi:hypothetical protein
MRLKPYFQVFSYSEVLLALIFLALVCIKLRMDANAKRQWNGRNFQSYEDAYLRSGFELGIRAATNSLTFDTNTGRWTLNRLKQLQRLWEIQPPAATQALTFDTNTGEWTFKNTNVLSLLNLTFDTNTGRWTPQDTNLLQPLTNARYGGRYRGRYSQPTNYGGRYAPPTNSSSGH